MLLGFQKKFPWGEPTHFVGKIIRGLPIDVFNDTWWEDKEAYKTLCIDIWEPASKILKIHTCRKGNRFKPGDRLHMVLAKRKGRQPQFAPILTCISVQQICIDPESRIVKIDNRELIGSELYWFSCMDGFKDELQMFRYFTEKFEGQLIHWTDQKY